MHLNKNLLFGLALSILAFTTGCDEADDTTPLANQTVYGKNVEIGLGSGRTWASFDAAGKPTAIGVTITEAAVKSLPQDDHSHAEGHMIMYEMELPTAVLKYTPFKHVVVDWNPMGHPPAMYQVPHFDAHFYTISREERLKVGDEISDPKMNEIPAPQYLPSDYVDIQVNVPQMGKHWLDKCTPEFNGRKFTQTFIYGSYAGKVAFYEPMFTLEYLQTFPDESFVLKQPSDFLAKGLYYPTKYSFRYNKLKREYNISVDEMELK